MELMTLYSCSLTPLLLYFVPPNRFVLGREATLNMLKKEANSYRERLKDMQFLG